MKAYQIYLPVQEKKISLVKSFKEITDLQKYLKLVFIIWTKLFYIYFFIYRLLVDHTVSVQCQHIRLSVQ